MHRVIAEQLTAEYDDLGLKCERDAFDTLFDHAPDKLQVCILYFALIDINLTVQLRWIENELKILLQVVKKSLVTFVNKHLNKINLEVMDLDTQFSDGVYLCLLSGLLEGYFVPLYDFHLTPQVVICFWYDIVYDKKNWRSNSSWCTYYFIFIAF